MLDALSAGKISEGHARPLMMLVDRPEEQSTLFKEILFKRLTVRESEMIARKIAVDRARKKEKLFDPEIVEMEQKLSETFGTRVQIEQKEKGGKITIDFFSPEDLRTILSIADAQKKRSPHEMLDNHAARAESSATAVTTSSEVTQQTVAKVESVSVPSGDELLDDRSLDEKVAGDNSEDLYSIKNFSL